MNKVDSSQRAIVYIDGYNFYYGLKKVGFRKYLWLNFDKFSQNLLLPSQKLVKIKYFTSAEIFAEESRKRQALYFDALATLPNLKRYMGHFQDDTDRWCTNCNQFVSDTREKRTDVNLATAMLVDAFLDRYDIAILISSDSDFIAPIQAVINHFQKKKVFTAISPGRSSKALRGVSTGIITITEEMLSNNQFPDMVTGTAGFDLLRPDDWR